MSNFYYLYCLKNKTQKKFSLKGIDRREVYVLPYRDIEAVVTEVSKIEFDPKKVESKLERDLKWVEEKIRNHEAVVKEAMKDSPVIPLKFLTLYKSRRSLNEILEKHYRKFRRLLDKLKGKAEWGVKVYLIDKEKLIETVKKDDQELMKLKEELISSPQGARYFLEKQLDEKSLDKINEKLDKYIKDIYEATSSFSEQRPATNKLLPKQLTNKKGEVILSLSCLIADDKLKSFQRAVERFHEYYHPNGLWIEYTGPWAPYSFIDKVT